jgi:hypothetical protein
MLDYIVFIFDASGSRAYACVICPVRSFDAVKVVFGDKRERVPLLTAHGVFGQKEGTTTPD